MVGPCTANSLPSAHGTNPDFFTCEKSSLSLALTQPKVPIFVYVFVAVQLWNFTPRKGDAENYSL